MFENLISTKLLRECFATLVMNEGLILTGLTLSYPACLIPQLKAEGHHVDTLTESLLGSISIMVLGVTTFFSVFIVGKNSRKQITRLSLIIYAIGTIIILISSDPIPIGIGLAVQALVLSIFGPVVMSYVSEICQKEHRSILLSTGFVCATIGLSLNYVTNSFVTWRMMAVVMLIITVSEFFLIFLIPESNYWYLMSGKTNEAKSSILWFEPTLTDGQLNERIATIEQANDTFRTEKKGQFSELVGTLRQKKFLKAFLLGVIINIFRSADGRLIIGVYIETIFKDIQTPYDVPILIRLFGWADILGSFVILFFVHRITRKTLIVVSSTILIVSLSFVVAYKFSQLWGNSLPHWLPIIGLYVYAMCVVTAYNSAIVIVISEIQVPTIRPQMTLLQNGFSLMFYWFYSFSFPHVEKVLPIQYIFSWFMLNIFITMMIVLLLFPETSKLEFYENEVKNKENSTIDKKGMDENIS